MEESGYGHIFIVKFYGIFTGFFAGGDRVVATRFLDRVGTITATEVLANHD